MPPHKKLPGRPGIPQALTDPTKLNVGTILERHFAGQVAHYKVLVAPFMDNGQPAITVAMWMDGKWLGRMDKYLNDLGIIPYRPDDWNEGYVVIVPKR